MCAIAGILGLAAPLSLRQKMMETMLRRGPDGRGEYCHEECTLLHTRLAIIDPEGGKQPMQCRWDGETYCITYNGELYNTEEIRRELLALGHQFVGHSDTEVVLHAYAEYGEDSLLKLNGIFAFGIWEEGRRRLFLARDRIGVKPLFYARRGEGLIFASEIKTLLQHPDVKPVLDREGAAQILLLGPGRIPGSGVFRDVEELEPGCYGYWQGGKLTTKQYWKLTDREHRESFPETVEQVRTLLTDAIRRQTVSDVPVGTFLSGGLDSSIITAICAGDMRRRGEIIQSFSVDYRNNDKYFTPGKFQPNSDPYYIDLMKNAQSLCHNWTVLSPEDLLAELENATIARDLPGMADVDFSLLAFCRKIRNHVKVALSGECADEIFGGYPWYRDPEIRQADGFPWSQNLSMRAELMHPALRQGIDPGDFVRAQYLKTCRESDILPGTSPLERRMKEMVNLNFRWFMQTLLDRKDRMSMYCGLEIRVPFCDYRIAEYLYGIPWEFKDFRGKEKGLLRAAVDGLLPEEVLWRKKSPYPKTFDPAYEEAVTRRLRELLEDKNAPLFALVNPDAVRAIFDREFIWPWYGQLMKRPQTMAYLLQIDFWLRHYAVDVRI